MSKKYVVIGYVTEIFVIDEVEADSKDDAVQKMKLDSEEGYIIEEDQFNKFIKDKKRISRKCEIDIGILDKENKQIRFNID